MGAVVLGVVSREQEGWEVVFCLGVCMLYVVVVVVCCLRYLG